MSNQYKEPPNYFALKFCSMGCNDDSAQTEISGNQIGTLAILPKQNEKQTKQQNLNDSRESDILDGISEKMEGQVQQKELIQPSISQKNTLSSLKQGGSFASTNKKPYTNGNLALNLNFKKADQLNSENLQHQRGSESQNDQNNRIVRVLGYEGSENAVSDDEHYTNQYSHINPNIQYQNHPVEKDKQSAYPFNLHTNNQQNQQYNNQNNFNNINDGSFDGDKQENLESTERFNTQFVSQKELQGKQLNVQGENIRQKDDQLVSPRFTEETAIYNNSAMTKMLQQKLLQDKLLISQLRNQNADDYLLNNPGQFQSLQSQRDQMNSNSQRMQQDQTSRSGSQQMQDKYSKMMNGISLSKGSLPSNQGAIDDGGYNSQQNYQEIIENNYPNQIANITSQMDQETFYPSNNQLSSQHNSINPNNFQIMHHNNNNNNNQYNPQMNNQIPHMKINQINNLGEIYGDQRQQQYNGNQIIQNQNNTVKPLQHYQIPKGYDSAQGNQNNIEMEERSSQFCDTHQIQAMNGDRPITADSTHGTEYTIVSQNNINTGRNAQYQQLQNQIMMNGQMGAASNYYNNPLNVYLMQQQTMPPNMIFNQNKSEGSKLRDQEPSEDIKCNYSQSINEILPMDIQLQQQHYLHQYNQKKKRDLVSDSHFFNSFNSTNFFQNQTLHNPNNISNHHHHHHHHNSTPNKYPQLSNSNNNINNNNNTNNQVVNLSANSEVHEYSKSKQLSSPVLDTSHNQPEKIQIFQLTNNQPGVGMAKNIVPQNSSYHSENQNDVEQYKVVQDSMHQNSNNNNEGNNQINNVDMSHIMQKVNDIQGKTNDQQINQVMLNSFQTNNPNGQAINNYNSINQYASSSANNHTGNFDTARTVSQVYLNSLHFHDAAGSNMQMNQTNTLTSSFDGRKKSESANTPQQSRNGVISSNHNLQTQYTFKQLDTPDAMAQGQYSLLQRFPIKETDRVQEQSELDGTLTNNYVFISKDSPDHYNERERRANNMMQMNNENETEEGCIPDDEFNHQINESNIEIDPVYKLSPKAKSQSIQSNNQIYNQNAKRNLLNSQQYGSYQSPQLQSAQQSQYQSIANSNNDYPSSNSSRQASPFNKLSLHLDKIEQIPSPMNIDPSPKATEHSHISQISPRRGQYNNEDKVKKSKLSNQVNNDFERQKIEAALMGSNEDNNQKLIHYIYESGLMKKHLPPIPQENSKQREFSSELSHQNSYDLSIDPKELNDPQHHQNTLQSNGAHQNAQYLNGKFWNQHPNGQQNSQLKPSIQNENTPNFNSQISNGSYQNGQMRNPQIPIRNSIQSQNSQHKGSPYNLLFEKGNQQYPISVPTSHNNHPLNQKQNKYLPESHNDSLNEYFITPDYNRENPMMNENKQDPRQISNDRLGNFSHASSIRGVYKVQPQRQTENSRFGNEWSQNNDGTLMFTRDGVDLPLESLNEHLMLLNSSKALKEKRSPSPPQTTHSKQQSGSMNSPAQEIRSRSTSPMVVKMTKASELLQKASQDRIKSMHEKEKKKRELILQREEEHKKRQEDKEIKQESTVKVQNEKLRMQNMKLKEQNDLLKKQVEDVISQNQIMSSVQSGASGSIFPQMQKQGESVVSGRLHSTPHKQTQHSSKSPQKNIKSTKMRSPSLNKLFGNNQAPYSLNHSINKSDYNNSNVKAASTQHPVVQIQMDISNNSNGKYHQNQNKNGEYNPHNSSFNNKQVDHRDRMNQAQIDNHSTGNSPNQNICLIDISKVLQQAHNTKSKLQQSPKQLQSDNISVNSQQSNNQGVKISLSDTYSADHPKVNYSPKINYSSKINFPPKNMNNGEYENNFQQYPPIQNHSNHNHNQNAQNNQIDTLSHNPSINSIHSKNSSPKNDQLHFANNRNQQQFSEQAHPNFQKLRQQSSHNGSIKNNETRDNSLADTNPILTKDTFYTNNLQQSLDNQLNSLNHHPFKSPSATLHPTKSSISSKPLNQLYDSKSSSGYENLQIHMSDQFSQKPSLNDISARSPEMTKKQLDFSSNKKNANNLNSSTKESINGQLVSNQSKSNLLSQRNSPKNPRKNDFMPKQMPQQNQNNRSDMMMSANQESIKYPIKVENQNNKSQSIRENVDKEASKLDMNSKYKLIQNMDSTYSLLQKNKPQAKSTLRDLQKSSFKNTFMPRQYNPDEINNKNQQQQNVSQDISYDQNATDVRNQQIKNEIKAPLKLVLVPQQQQQIQQQTQQKYQIDSNRSKLSDGMGSNQKHILEKKQSTPSLTLPKTSSNISIGMKSNRSSNKLTQPELSSNFINQNQSSYQLSNHQLSSKNGQTQLNNQPPQVASSQHLRSQSYGVLPKNPNQVQNAGTPETNKMINSAMNSIFQKIENCYDNISAGYDQSVNVLKKENK